MEKLSKILLTPGYKETLQQRCGNVAKIDAKWLRSHSLGNAFFQQLRQRCQTIVIENFQTLKQFPGQRFRNVSQATVWQRLPGNCLATIWQQWLPRNRVGNDSYTISRQLYTTETTESDSCN